ncbi:sensor histidine kinase [Rhizobium sp. PAMB 3174]
MAAPRVRIKWRPPLALIVFAVLLAVMSMPVAIVLWFRVSDAGGEVMETAEVAALAVAAALTLMIAYVLTRTITTPIGALVERTREIASGGKAAIVPLSSYGTREIAVLSQGFFDLATKLVDRTEYVRGFAAHVSHELKSPLTAIRGAAELLGDDDDEPMAPEDRRRFLKNIIDDVDRLDALLVRLRELAYAEAPLAEGHVTAGDVVDLLQKRFPQLAVIGDGDLSRRMALSIEAAAIVFGNLADNARQHGATRLTLSAVGEAGTLAVRVTDNGNGIAEGIRNRIFDPFFSTRAQEGGTGIGLDIVRNMLNTSQGTVSLVETGPSGTTFEVVVPSAR